MYPILRRVARKAYFLPTYIDGSRFECKRKIFSDEKVKFLYVGRFDKEKGIDVLIKALRNIVRKHNMANFEFYFIGHGSLETIIKKLAQENPCVKYVGAVDNKEMPLWYNKIDVVVLPSYTEGMPAVLLEALLCKRLVIATEVGSIPLLLRDTKGNKYGILVSPGNSKELAETILRIINGEKTQYYSMVIKERERVKALLRLYERNIMKHLHIKNGRSLKGMKG